MADTMTRPCNVSNNGCVSPAGYGVGVMVGENDRAFCRLTCFACGLPVCRKCSRKIGWYNYGIQLVCENCTDKQKLRGIQ